MFYQDKHTRDNFFKWLQDHPLFNNILWASIGYIAAFALCTIVTIMLGGCKRTVEEVTTTTNVEIQKDTTHSVLDTYDRVEIKDKSIYDTWYNFDSLLAHIRIIDFDTLGRPVRFVDADVQHGTAKGGSTTVKDKDSTKTYQAHADTTASTIREKESKESRVVTAKLPWWQRTSFRIAIAVLAAIIAILIAYLTRHRWLNRILSWLLHTK